MRRLKYAVTILAILVAFLLLSSSHIFAKTVIVNTDTLKLRKEASTDSTTLELLNLGDKLEYIEETGNWYKVTAKGMTGYVSKDYVKLEEDKTTTNTEQTENTVTNTDTSADTNTVTNTEVNTVVEENIVPEPVIEEEQTQITQTVEAKILKDGNVYILPLINASVIQNIKKDSNVTIITKTIGWAYVETDEMMGWIRQDLLGDSTVVSDDISGDNQPTTPSQTPNTDTDTTNTDTEVTQKTMYVNTSSVYVRKGPSTEFEIVDSLILNNGVTVTAENGDWYKVEIDGKTGYIAKRLLSNKTTDATSRGDDREEPTTTATTTANSANSSKGEQIVAYAKSYLGCKYVYGASGPSTFDCSGFTMYVFKNFGISLSHSATAQSKVGTYVAKENLQAGDLVFFTDYETGSGIGHCGIYVGSGNFIHASSGTGYCVKTSTLLSGSYLTRYETARRVI